MKTIALSLLILLVSCADVTKSGQKVHIIESSAGALDIQDKADFLTAHHQCEYLGFADPKTALFPPSYSLHENEVHAALRNEAAKRGGNVVIANFQKKPALGVVLNCPAEYLKKI